MAYSEYPKDEAAKWAAQVDEAARKMKTAIKGALGNAAASGFDDVPGPAMAQVAEACVAAKITLTQANGKIYADAVEAEEKAAEVERKVAFGFARLDMEAYRARLENAHDLEKATDDHGVEVQRARVERLRSEVERGQVAIIEERAKIEADIDEWRLVGIAAEDDALDAEVDLSNERVRTARARLAIIDHLHAVIEAEQLVLDAERRKAAIMEQLVVAEQAVLEARRGLIPLQKQKATARLAEADAIRQEAEVKRDIEELGYERIAVKRSEDAAEHRIRQAEEDHEEARLLLTRAERQTEYARAQLRTALMAYQNLVRERVATEKAVLEQSERTFRLDYQHLMNKFSITQDAAYLDTMRALAIVEAQRKMKAIREVTSDKASSIHSTRVRGVVRESVHHETLYVDKG